MKSQLVSISFSLLLLAACATKEQEKSDHSDEIDLYTIGKGVVLPETVRASISLQTAEVAEREFTLAPQLNALVFHAPRGAEPCKAAAPLNGEASRDFPPGAKVLVWIDSKRVDGTILSHSAGEAIIEFAAPDGPVAVGSEIQVSSPNPAAQKSLALPKIAVQEGVDGSFVYVQNGEFFTRTIVKTGVVDGQWIQVLDGLYEGDVVATSGARTLWMIELHALRGGTPCCPVPKKNA